MIVAFTPSATANFQFQATFDGVAYNVIVTWSLYGLRYYVNIYTTQGALVACVPLIESPDNRDISMTAGYFTTTLVYRASLNQFEVS